VYLRDVGETSSHNAGHLRLYEAVAVRRDNGRIDEPKEDSTVHRVHCRVRKMLGHNLSQEEDIHNV
jgi:hypothetical protein